VEVAIGPVLGADPEALARHLAELSGLEAVACPEDLVASLPDHRSAVCGLPWDGVSFRKNWRDALDEHDVRYRSVWHRAAKGVSSQTVWIDDVIVRVFEDDPSRLVAVVWPRVFRPCPGEPSLELNSPAPLPDDPTFVPPRLIQRFSPSWPATLPDSRPGGRVSIEGTIDSRGVARPQCVRGVTPVGAGLEEAAFDAFSKWTYEPATRGGTPVETTTSMVFDFDR
jgi:hypothetical protein